MSSTPIFEVRPDPNESLRGGYSQNIRFLMWRLRPGVLFYYRSVFDYEMTALLQPLGRGHGLALRV